MVVPPFSAGAWLVCSTDPKQSDMMLRSGHKKRWKQPYILGVKRRPR